MAEVDFTTRFGAVYEDSPWVADGVWADAAVLTTAEAMAKAMAEVVDRLVKGEHVYDFEREMLRAEIDA